MSPLTSDIATEGVPSNDGNGVTKAMTVSPLPSGLPISSMPARPMYVCWTVTV